MSRKQNKNDKILLAKLCCSFLIALLHFYGMCLLSQNIYSNCLFFDPGLALLPSFVVSCIIFFSPFTLTCSPRVWLNKNFKKAIALILVFASFIVFSFATLQSGIIADENGIRKTNIFGQTIDEYAYEKVACFEMSFQYGIQYDIQFHSGESISIMSHQVIFLNAFKNDHNIMMFDKRLAQYATRNVYYSYRARPENMRRFLKESEVFQYFNKIFNPQQDRGRFLQDI